MGLATVEKLKAAGWKQEPTFKDVDPLNSFVMLVCLEDREYWIRHDLPEKIQVILYEIFYAVVVADLPPRINMQMLQFEIFDEVYLAMECYFKLSDYASELFSVAIQLGYNEFVIDGPGMVLCPTAIERLTTIIMDKEPGPGGGEWHTLKKDDRVRIVRADTPIQKLLKRYRQTYRLQSFSKSGDLATVVSNNGIFYQLELTCLGRA